MVVNVEMGLELLHKMNRDHVVFEMPNEACEQGGAEQLLPLQRIPRIEYKYLEKNANDENG